MRARAARQCLCVERVESRRRTGLQARPSILVCRTGLQARPTIALSGERAWRPALQARPAVEVMGARSGGVVTLTAEDCLADTLDAALLVFLSSGGPWISSIGS